MPITSDSPFVANEYTVPECVSWAPGDSVWEPTMKADDASAMMVEPSKVAVVGAGMIVGISAGTMEGLFAFCEEDVGDEPLPMRG